MREMFAKQLMQIFGITLNSAAAIVKEYPTPALLRKMILAGEEKSEEAREMRMWPPFILPFFLSFSPHLSHLSSYIEGRRTATTRLATLPVVNKAGANTTLKEAKASAVVAFYGQPV